MSHAEIEDLAGLALGSDDVPESVVAHVAECAECAELVHSLAEVRALAGAEPLVSPPVHLRAQVLNVMSEPPVDSAPSPVSTAAPAPIASPISMVGRTRRRGLPLWAVGIAATTTLVAGLGLGRFTADPAQQPTPEALTTVVAAADLTALDSDASRGVASAVRTDDVLTLRVQAAELGDEPGIHEVWLINVDGTRMVSLGLLAAGDEGAFSVPIGLIEKGYRIVDISVEPDDGDPVHSGVSLARGELA